MALFDIQRPVPLYAGSVNRFFGSIFAVAGDIRAWSDARRTHKALSRLSLRELDDIGLVPGDIDRISRR